jgi:hypothetical protein
MPRWMIYLLLAVACLIGAAAFGWWLGQPEPVVETAAPEQRQEDGSVVLERKPDAKARPKQRIPPKAKLERVAQVTVQAAAVPVSGEPCPPVSLDLSLVREDDGGRRLLASSPDGTIVGGVDVPVETAAPPPKPLRWAAGMSWSPANETAGLWIERDVPLFSTAARVGIDLNQERALPGSSAGADLRVRVGLAF